MLKKKSLWLAAFAVLSLVIFTACSTEEDNTLTVGMEMQYPPFESTNAKGEPEGISVEMAEDLAEYMGKDLEIQNIAWSGLIPAVQSGKVDVIISSMTVRPDREESVDFSIPYANAQLAILANKDSGIEEASDLNEEGRRVAVKVGTTGFLYANENLENAEINTIKKTDTGILEVAQGKSDAFIYGQLTIYRGQKEYPDSTVALLDPFDVEPEPWAMAIKKDQPELLEEINNFIRDYKEKGGFNDLADKYLGDMKATFDELGLEFFFQPRDE
ncbi:MAG: transporter substrate-binding domain-containing protein [Atopostipes suicloacalis]|nr:transporter substrate-binding domain-containing protein [Atopostipes suicloacalis]